MASVHTLESCKASALQYQTRSQWKSSPDNANYQAAIRNGWIEQCAAHMTVSKGGAKLGERTYTTEQWIEKYKAVHGDRYDTSNVVYNGSQVKVKLGCAEHGMFEQVAASGLNGAGCPKCGLAKQVAARTGRRTGKSALNKHTQESAIALSNIVHDGYYTYPNAVYTGNKNKWEVECPVHGSFWQLAGGHMAGKGCRLCATTGPSNAETELFNFVKSLAPDAVQSDRTLLSGKELDILIPSCKIAIEHNGLIWHSERFNSDRKYHQNKTDEAKARGYHLIHIWSDEWLNQREWCEAFLKMQLVGCQRKFHARKCDVVAVDIVEANLFHTQYHLQGRRTGESFAVKYEGETLAVGTVEKGELARWTVKHGVTVVGGLSRVMKAFNRPLISFCDTAKHEGKGYLAAGFTLSPIAWPTYWYTDGKVRKSRTQFQKHKLKSLGAVGVTEKEMAGSLGFYRISGCKQLKLKWEPK